MLTDLCVLVVGGTPGCSIVFGVGPLQPRRTFNASLQWFKATINRALLRLEHLLMRFDIETSECSAKCQEMNGCFNARVGLFFFFMDLKG